jgi:hypothetical protein
VARGHCCGVSVIECTICRIYHSPTRQCRRWGSTSCSLRRPSLRFPGPWALARWSGGEASGGRRLPVFRCAS